MLDQSGLEAGLERLRAQLEKNILERAEDEPSVREGLQRRYDAAKTAKRTGLAFELWRENEITQAAVAWLLGCVFVRFLEDNLLIDQPWISGPGERLAQAKEHNIQTYRAGLHKTDRDYLLLCFDEMSKLPGVAGLFDKEHNPLYRLAPTGHGARAIIDFFQRTGDDGNLLFDFSGTVDNTRFLGDLYQNISESARKRYALVQTPDFVVDFILDRTMNPALEEFGLEGFRMIDPACGSGHFLLAAFDRLFRRWQQHAPDLGPVEHVNRALGSIFGVDLNPFAVEIARFRLLIAALRACEVQRLRDNFDFQLNLATGDSLLHGTRPGTTGVQRHAFDGALDFYYEAEDKARLREYLRHGIFHVAVGNPPYITAKDPCLRDAYRYRFASCSGTYQLSVPFTERCFDLTMRGDHAGYVGLIMSNAFTKRSFGRKLIQEILPKWDLTHAIDASGVELEGYGTPTVIWFGRNREPVQSVVRVVRGIRGDARDDPKDSKSPTWRAIVNQIDSPGSISQHVSAEDADRALICKHPWSMGGGGTADLKARMDRSFPSLRTELKARVGGAVRIAHEEAFIFPRAKVGRTVIPRSDFRGYVIGEGIRDWSVSIDEQVWFPYGPAGPSQQGLKNLWPWRVLLENRATFQGVMADAGLEWYEYMQFTAFPYETPLTITFAFVTTHNQFVLDRGGNVFNRSAPAVKLPRDLESEQRLVGLVGLLNASTTGFWMRQICYSKDGGVEWHDRFEYDGGKLANLPIPNTLPTSLSTALDELASQRMRDLPAALIGKEALTTASLSSARTRAEAMLKRMIALQEELDWEVYHLYGLTKESITLPIDQVPEIELGQRAFEIAMARQMANGELETEWFNRHGSTPITEIPAHWPEPYRQLVQKRLDIIATDRDIALIEQPEYKRRWNLPKWEDLETEALRNWLLDRLEDSRYWPAEPPMLRTVANLAAAAAEDTEFVQVAELYKKRSDFKMETLVSELVEKESILFLPVLRYKPSGLIKRKLWEETWALQRREDAGEKLEIPVPPKYEKGDFATDTGWRLRGKLDVPKERWVSYPHLESNADRSLLIGWAGYDHAQQAIALATYYQAAREDGWSNERLIPILAGIQELLPWVLQWHNQPDATGTGTGDFLAEFLRDQLSYLNLSEADIRAWTPSQKTRTKPKRMRGKKSTAVEVAQ